MPREPNRINRFEKQLILVVLAIFVLCATACVSHIQQLRVAQDQFSRAAYMENQVRLGDPGAAILIAGDATSSYRVAARIISGLLEKRKDELERDRLLGTAYTIKAMSEWRLGEFSEAVRTSEMALNDPKIELFPRDRVLLEALRGLIKNDQAFLHMMRHDYPYNGVKHLLRDALGNLDKALLKAPDGSRIRLYILMSELVVLKNWADLRGSPARYADSIPTDFNKKAEIDEWCKSARDVWDKFSEESGHFRDAGEQLLRDWGRRLGMPGACSQKAL